MKNYTVLLNFPVPVSYSSIFSTLPRTQEAHFLASYSGKQLMFLAL
ncbi:hypothetical protein B7P43_G06205 [Cryptotermes secundus]|uniref:Uncharacterized protein n=1 Tax=Cryptotermes secundus TaxID=105785 RepID=A0A2J7RAN9_9NEOP|nr:hypothetical protein B7P43_G06205 [Cryptotermes secundus]